MTSRSSNTNTFRRCFARRAIACWVAATVTATTLIAITVVQPSSTAEAMIASNKAVLGTSTVARVPNVSSQSSRSVTVPSPSWGGVQRVHLDAGMHALAAAPITGVSLRTASGVGANVDVVADTTGPNHTPRLRVASADGKALPALAVTVADSSLAGQYGADYASRVRWQQQSSTGSRSIARQQRLSGATAVMTSSVRTGAMTLVAVAAPAAANGTGTFSATSLSPASSWDVSPQTGSFSWNYSLRVPTVPGPSPDLSLSYNTGSIDGETGSTNNQPGPIGDGWSLAGAGFVERSYAPCASDGASTSGDMCWSGDNLSISFGGHSGRLVSTGSGNQWRLQDDDGTRIEKLTGAANGDSGNSVDGVGEYWKVTTTDGTQYFFGLNRLPGWVAGNPETQSAWTVPVFGNNSGEPCYNATFASASCTQAWRWNLDYVVDTHGLSEAFYYTPETNMYSRNGSTAVSYTRGGQLARIAYGTTGGSSLTSTEPVRVVFDLADRCVPGSTCDRAHPASWPDTPWDQQCDAAPCTGHLSPTFFTSKRIGAIHTQLNGSTGMTDVDKWTLNQTYPAPGDTTSPALWLSKVSHVGTDSSGATASVPDTVFNGTTKQNRVTVVDGSALLWRYRMSSITTETGASIAINYAPTQCTATLLPTPESNSMRCFPQWWAPPGQNPTLDWFHKYLVASVTANPVTGGAQPVDTTFYNYYGGPAWRYETGSSVPSDKRTWSEFAGYGQVLVRHGDDSDPASQQSTSYLYYRGLDGDRLNTSGGTKSVKIAASDGSQVADSRWLAGRVRETTVGNGNSGARTAPVLGPRISNTISTPWASAPTATQGTLTARLTGDADDVTKTALSTGGDRTTETKQTYDAYGRVTQVSDLGDVSVPSDDRCTNTTYDDNTASWLLNFPSRVTTTGVACGVVPTFPANAISAVRSFYDGATSETTAPVKGDVTRTDVVDSYGDATEASAHWMTRATSTFDSLGRVTSTTDPRIAPARTTSTSYVPTGAGPITQTTVTNPLGWTAVSALDPRWGVPTKVTDANAHVTEATYDALGRRTNVWLPDRPRASNTTPSVSFAYTVSATSPSAVATTRLNATGLAITSYQLLDGLGRPRQTQAPAPGGGTQITDTLYDAAGRVTTQNATYWTPQISPGTTLFTPGTSVPGQVVTGYDGAGRTLYSAQRVNNAEVWRTSYAYGGDHVDVTAPSGGTSTSTWTDARGNTTKLAQYLGTTPTGAAQVTTYGYGPAGQMTSMTDPGGDRWTWGYDVLGRNTVSHDPDTGDHTLNYDAADRVVSESDARPNTLAFTYDLLDRKTAEYAGSTSGAMLASWSYDTLSKGQLTSSTRYVSGAAFATDSVTTYDAADRVTASQVVVNSGVMAGTYRSVTNYGQDGQITYVANSAAGGLPAEGLIYDYDNLGKPSAATLTGVVSLVGSTTYAATGEVSKYTDGIGSKTITRTFTYTDGTRRLAEDWTLTNFGGTGTIADHKYTYNPAGLVTADHNATYGSIPTDAQCYAYDNLQQLTEAWTPASGDCSATRSSAALGGPAPYWQSYSYNNLGSRVAITRHAAAGATSDRTDTYTYPAPGSSTVRPHAVTTVTIPPARLTLTRTTPSATPSLVLAARPCRTTPRGTCPASRRRGSRSRTSTTPTAASCSTSTRRERRCISGTRSCTPTPLAS